MKKYRFKQIIKLQALLIKSGKGSKPTSNLMITWLKVWEAEQLG